MQLSRFLSATKHIEHFSKVGNEANILNSLLPLILSVARFRLDITGYLLRFLRIAYIEERFATEKTVKTPIALLIVCGPSDVEILSFAIKSAILFSKNPITEIAIISPNKCLRQIKIITESISVEGGIRMQILDEDDYINEDQRNELRNQFGNRYGWILQQLIKFKWTSESSSNAILVQDADTVFLREFDSITAEGKQVISYSAEFQKSYFSFLRYLGIRLKKPIYSTVTHHQVIQPRFMREMMISCNIVAPDTLLSKISNFQKLKEDNRVSVDYELYGQYMRINHMEELEYRKFCNVPRQRTYESVQEVENILSGTVGSHYRSVSFHAYLGFDSNEK